MPIVVGPDIHILMTSYVSVQEPKIPGADARSGQEAPAAIGKQRSTFVMPELEELPLPLLLALLFLGHTIDRRDTLIA